MVKISLIFLLLRMYMTLVQSMILQLNQNYFLLLTSTYNRVGWDYQ